MAEKKIEKCYKQYYRHKVSSDYLQSIIKGEYDAFSSAGFSFPIHKITHSLLVEEWQNGYILAGFSHQIYIKSLTAY